MFSEEEIKKYTRRWYALWIAFFIALFLAALFLNEIDASDGFNSIDKSVASDLIKTKYDTIPGYEWLGNMPGVKMVIRQGPTWGPRRIEMHGGYIIITGSDSLDSQYPH